MAAEPNHDNKTEHTKIAREIGVTLTTLGGVASLAQLVEYMNSGKLNYVLSATFAVMAIIGIAVLLAMSKRSFPWYRLDRFASEVYTQLGDTKRARLLSLTPECALPVLLDRADEVADAIGIAGRSDTEDLREVLRSIRDIGT